ncbi:MAG: tetratricopeptide repeat protein [Prevotellaceae bacterium]|nr:tetratricopeptide repeat protein [Prevotellaceae bacterium]
MKILNLILIATFVCTLSYGAGDKKFQLPIVSITATDINNQTTGRATGFIVAADSSNESNVLSVVSPYTLLRNAVKAVVTDPKNNTHTALRISGANDLYDVAKFTIANTPDITPLSLANKKLAIGDKAYIVNNKQEKKKPLAEVKVTQADEYSGLTYYTLSATADTSLIGTPLLTADNKVVGVIQKNASANGGSMYAIGIEFFDALKITTMSAADPSLNNIHIAKQLPDDEKQAASYLYLFARNSEDTISYAVSLNDFITKYPENSFGYNQSALFYASNKQYSKAEQIYNEALGKCTDKADIHYNMSVMLYNLNQDKSYSPYKDWTLNRALAEIKQAYELQPTPIYLMQQGKCLYALKKYHEAYDTYDKINKTNFRSSENLFCQSRSLQMAGGDSTVILALLDSAVVRFIKPYKEDAAPYVYYRAQQYDRYGFYREAVVGYQDYQDIVGLRNLNDKFFYIKEQAEIKSNFYPQALADIERAIAINPNEYVYYIEKALIETRTGNYEEAILTAAQARKLDANDPDSYKLAGISYGELGNKTEARKNLERAIELGDEEARSWLNSMK